MSIKSIAFVIAGFSSIWWTSCLLFLDFSGLAMWLLNWGKDMCWRNGCSAKTFDLIESWVTIIFRSFLNELVACLDIQLWTWVSSSNLSQIATSGPRSLPVLSTVFRQQFDDWPSKAVLATRLRCSLCRSAGMLQTGFPSMFTNRDHNSCSLQRGGNSTWYCMSKFKVSMA